MTRQISAALFLSLSMAWAEGLSYPIVDTNQNEATSDTAVIATPRAGQAYAGQDACHKGHQPSYKDNGDGTVTDLVTGMMWEKDMGQPIAFEDAVKKAKQCKLGGYSDWRVPTIKELYSLIDFSGRCMGEKSITMFIDTKYFNQPKGDTSSGGREIDAQTWSATEYVGKTMNGDRTIFGVNFVDGRIKGYPVILKRTQSPLLKYVRLVRGNKDYGKNKFKDNGDGTISDLATGLMWQKADDGKARNWKEALAYAQNLKLAGKSDWRLPNAKELQSIVDYSRSTQTTKSAAIDPKFKTTSIEDWSGQKGHYPYFWTSTTHHDGPNPYAGACYIAFGEAFGVMNGKLLDVHGAGCQRSDAKSGSKKDYPQSMGPQGDVRYVYNYVRCVRDIKPSSSKSAPAATPAPVKKEGSWSFVVISDTEIPSCSDAVKTMLPAIQAEEPDLLLVCGDLIDGGEKLEPFDMRQQLNAWINIFNPLYQSGIKIYPLRGGNEFKTPINYQPWSRVFVGDYALPQTGPEGEKGFSFSFTHNNAFFIGLDQYVKQHRVNITWLDEQLKSNTKQHVFTFGHEPAFKVGAKDCLQNYPTDRNALWASLLKAGARSYFCGGDHFFDLARIENGDGKTDDDLYQIVLGTAGGKSLADYKHDGNNAPYTVKPLKHLSKQGYLLVEVVGDKVVMSWKEKADDGSYKAACTLRYSSGK